MLRCGVLVLAMSAALQSGAAVLAWQPARGFRAEGGSLFWEESAIRSTEEMQRVVSVEGNAVGAAPSATRTDCRAAVEIEPGHKYSFSMKVRGVVTNNCAYVFFAWYDAADRMIGRAEAKPVLSRKENFAEWTKLSTSTQRIPSAAVRAEVFIEVYRTTLGRMEFAEPVFEKDEYTAIERVFSSAYRDEATEGGVKFVAPYFASRKRCPQTELRGRFVFANGLALEAAVGEDAFTAEVEVAKLPKGTSEVRAELSCRGKPLGSGTMDFSRPDSPTPRRVRFDARGRTLLDGRPYLPLGVYVHPRDLEVPYLERLKGGPFNCVIESAPTKAMLDKYHSVGMMVLPRGSLSVEGAKAAAAELKNHPALFAWYVIDETPPARVAEKRELYETFRAVDPDHPAFAVLDYPRNVGAFLGTFDVIASDPYPVGYKRIPISSCADYPATCLRNSFGIRPLWQVPQSFAWDWCHRNGHPEEDRYPTLKELRAMSWMAIAGGANGLFWYSAHHIFKCEKPEKLEESWGNLVKVAAEIRRHEALILSDEEAPQAVSDCVDIAVRAFRKDGKVWVLAVNKKTESVSGKVKVEGCGEVTFELPGLGIKTHRFNSVNYDEAKVGEYTLEDPLLFADGTPVRTAADWPKRRAEILGIFAREMYGEEPPKPEAVVCETFERGETLAGLALREQTRMWFRADRSGPAIDWLVIRPKYAKGPVPVIVQLNYYGNHDFLTDPEVVLPRGWMQNETLSGGYAITNHCGEASMRGRLRRTDQRYAFPIDTMIARGCAFMTACYADVSPDPDYLVDDMEDLPYTGVFELWGKRDPSRTDDITSLGAWAWALSRGLDLAERHPDLDAKRSVVTGCSRLGKAALLAAARDERFAVCAPNQTGNGGVPLAKRNYGENVFREIEMFPHWFCRAYRKYIDNEKAMAFDQHLLLAAIAPRALLVQGFDRAWFDPKGEWLSVKAAAPVWKFLGAGELPETGEPECFSTAAIGRGIGYVRRRGQHGIAGYDWQWIMDFADRTFGR